ncbi:hypothetical protein BDF20DRAFT_85822 [Mycotypha africana]|uniref:uncharacterized protein n=1 Tax=Mycotypha africana TaxID=64632 RepID=UPI00230141C6|nr:uncharacterized protein BDF20DRAFT_85822 [Mycotypha africana]KAI8992083.1 hypothetical protein BDF20DRAFT_85822 [Mycotypha africana]
MDPTTISTTATPTTATPASQLQLLEIPQFVVIHDQVNNTYKHPVVHYAFEDEEFPIVPKDKLILVDLDSTATHLKSVNSYSPHFQVTECIVEQGQMSDQFDHDVPLVNLTIEGTAAPRIRRKPTYSKYGSFERSSFQFQE